jgi:hypothetical protein
MGKLDEFIKTYTQKSGIIVEAEDTGTIPPPEDPAMTPPVDPAMAQAPPPELKDLTTIGYANAVKDMIAMLQIGLRSPDDFRLDDRVIDILETDVDPGDAPGGIEGNVVKTHDLIRNLIQDLGTEID